MNPEKIRILEQKLAEFLSKTPEEMHEIDENPKYDGLFDIIEEMSAVVESSCGYKTFLDVNSGLMPSPIQVILGLPYRTEGSSGRDVCGQMKIFSDNSLSANEDYDYAWAA